MANELRHAVIGLPKSGKTTFLAALWHLITADEVDTGLVCRSTRGDGAYLTEIADCWRRCLPMERTRSLSAAYLELELSNPAADREFDLSFPDVAGESFHEQLLTRQLDSKHATWLQHPGGTLLFISAETAPDGQRLSDLDGLLDDDDEDKDEMNTELNPGVADEADTNAQISATEAEANWTPKMMTEQAKLVDLLQIARHLDVSGERRRLAVIISAWDLVAEEGQSPYDWLKRERPLLWQFIQANSNDQPAKVFGVSAQGGRVEDSKKRAELLDMASPSERISCVDGEVADHDLTRPIRWLNQPFSS
jgi:hypothetical protein